MNRYYSRKFTLTAFASICAMVLCWYGKLSGGEWVTVQTMILGMYKAANVFDGRGVK